MKMPKYVLTYHGVAGPMPSEPTEIEAVMAEWGAWYGTMGDNLVDGGAPFGAHTAVGPGGSSVASPASLTGYTVVKAADLDAAVSIAQRCPVLANGQTVQISEAVDMG